MLAWSHNDQHVLDVANHVRRWRAACEVLATMEHLEDLEITIAVWSRTPTRRGATDDNSVVVVLEPLKSVRATRFEVVLTERLTDGARKRLGSTPFVVTKRSRPGIGFYTGEEDD